MRTLRILVKYLGMHGVRHKIAEVRFNYVLIGMGR